MPEGFSTIGSGPTRQEIAQRRRDLLAAAAERGESESSRGATRRMLFDTGDDPLPGETVAAPVRRLPPPRPLSSLAAALRGGRRARPAIRLPPAA